MSPVHACGTLEPVPPSPPAALGVALIHAVNSREWCLAALCGESCAIVARCCRCLSGYLGKHPLLYPSRGTTGSKRRLGGRRGLGHCWAHPCSLWSPVNTSCSDSDLSVVGSECVMSSSFPTPLLASPLLFSQAWQDLAAAPKHLCLLLWSVVGWGEEDELPKPQLWSIPVCPSWKGGGERGLEAPHVPPRAGDPPPGTSLAALPCPQGASWEEAGDSA